MTEAQPGVVRRIYGNLGKLLGGKAAAGIISLAYMALAARALGPTDYGVLILVHGFALTVGGIVEFPGWHAVVRYGAQAVAADDPHRLARLLRFTASVEAAAGLIAVVVAAVLAPLIGPHLGWPPAAIAFAVPYSLAVLASIRSTPAGYLQLAGRFDLLGAHNLVAPVTRLTGAGIAFALGAGLKGYLVAWLVAALVEWLAMWLLGIVVARRRLGVALIGSPRGAVADNPGLWRFMVGANADITFGELSGRIAPLMVGWVLGPAAAGLYAIAQRATVVIAQPAQILGQAAYAELARLVAGGRRDDVRRALVRCIAVALAAAVPLLAGIAVFGRDFAVLIGGKSFAGAAPLMLWLAASRAILLVQPPASAALIALGRPGLSVTATLVTSLGMLPLLPPLMSAYGRAGSGIHALLQASVTAALIAWFVVRADADRRPVALPC